MSTPVLAAAVSIALLAAAGCARSNSPAASAEHPAAGPAKSVAAQQATAATFRDFANDSAVWVDAADPQRSLLLLAGGEGGLEIHDLDGKQLARFEDIEAGFVKIAPSPAAHDAGQAPETGSRWIVASDQRLGALRVFELDRDALKLKEITSAPLAIDDSITGLCMYRSSLTGQLYAFASTDQGLLQQWQIFADGNGASGRLIRAIPAGKGAGHCVADEQQRVVYFSEEATGIWRIAAEPESDAARSVVDLVEPRGSLHEEVKGLALHRNGTDAHLIARDAGAGTFIYYGSDGRPGGTFKIEGGAHELGDAEGMTIVDGALGEKYPRGLLVVADEDAGNYKLVSLAAVGTALGLPAQLGAPAQPPKPPLTVQPTVETTAVASYGDAADDPAIWVDPKDPARSVVIGTDKKLGLNVYDLQGKVLQTLPDGRMNNVDLRSGFTLGGQPTIVVAATNRTTKSISIYRLDPASRKLESISAGTLESGLEDPYGLCMYRSAKSGRYYVLANDSVDGRLVQWQLVDTNGKVTLQKLREIAVGSQAEGCAADDELGHLYVAEEDVGLWKYSAEPDAGDARKSLDDVEKGNLDADVEGVSIYYSSGGRGYLVVSNQGEDNYAIYRREGDNAYVGKVHVVANERAGIDGASETDGLDVVSSPLGAQYPAGLLVVQDGRNLMPNEKQNFKLVSFADVLERLGEPRAK